MNLLKRIKIENIKGKDVFEVTFDDLTANQPNIVVAPNGYGKSTIAEAFEAAAHGRMKLDDKDIYQHDPKNKPKLEVELLGENKGIYVATDTNGDISKNINVFTINSPLYAKSIKRGFGEHVSTTADLRVEQVVLYNQIPENISLNYSFKSNVSRYGSKKTILQYF